MAKKIQITAKTDGFRRAGIVHSSTPQLYDIARFSAEELKQLKAEPQLIVVEVEGSVEKKADASGSENNADKEPNEKKSKSK